MGTRARIEVTFLEAVRRVVDEEDPLTGADGGFVYGFAYDAICGWAGRGALRLSSRSTSAGSTLLAGLGVALRVTDLCLAARPFRSRSRGSFPSLGRWTCEQLSGQGAGQASRLGLDAVAASCVRQVQDWYSQLEGAASWGSCSRSCMP